MNLDDLTPFAAEDDLENFSPEAEALAVIFEKAEEQGITLPRELLETIYKTSAQATDVEREKISYSTHGKNMYALIRRAVEEQSMSELNGHEQV